MPSKYGFGNTRKKSPYEKHGKAMYGADQKNPVMLTKEGKEKIMASDANPEFKAAIEKSPIDMYGKKHSPAKGYKSAAQRKAVHASKAEKKESMAKDYKKGYYGA
tara:strand:- start:497 stop:811 length:315 start_codon:yes stop_codon:yes gene_type:complete